MIKVNDAVAVLYGDKKECIMRVLNQVNTLTLSDLYNLPVKVGGGKVCGIDVYVLTSNITGYMKNGVVQSADGDDGDNVAVLVDEPEPTPEPENPKPKSTKGRSGKVQTAVKKDDTG